MATQTPIPTAVAGAAPVVRPPADRFMRRVLRIRDGETGSITDAQHAFSTSIYISALRCLVTYVALPLLGPIVGIRGNVGPVLGIVIGAVSVVAIIVSMRRFWRADHRMRWGYTAIGGTILVFLVVSAAVDLAALL